MWEFIGAFGVSVFFVGLAAALIMVVMSKPVWKKTLVVAGIGLILFSAGCSNDNSTPKQSSTFNWANSEINNDTVKQALAQKKGAKPIALDSDFPGDISDIKVVDNVSKPGMKNILIYYKPGTSWDETDFVKRAGGTAINVGSLLFSNPKIDEVTLFTQTEMTDQYGKTSLDSVVKIVLNGDIAKKVDWTGLAERHISDPGNIYRICDNYSIHPGILKKVKLSEIKL